MMARWYIAIAVLLLAVSVFLSGCGGGGQTQTTSTLSLQGSYVGTVYDPARPAAVKCEVTIFGSTVDGNIEDVDGNVLGTIHGTLNDDDTLDINFEFDGQSEGENGTIEVNDDGDVDINFENNDEGESESGDTTDSVTISLTRA
jgi:hypothetical protein